eukprot:CAMPEP_0115335308 /NCGR_PEP_ID=MMETSP0270-20121206/88382_1 /TAXON_ID=71861 /ORGANISM="Scrippsiella trochoidea, Strain CCMP3099" /LENGTH=34 /DNA_ID= /DNA_START= /DNA_END= /DNA_ORIENTATION=
MYAEVRRATAKGEMLGELIKPPMSKFCGLDSMQQ